MFMHTVAAIIIALSCASLIQAEVYYCYKTSGSKSKSGQCYGDEQKAVGSCPSGGLYIPDHSGDGCTNSDSFHITSRGWSSSTTESSSVSMRPYVTCLNNQALCKTNTAKVSGYCCIPATHPTYILLMSGPASNPFSHTTEVTCKDPVTVTNGKTTCLEGHNQATVNCGKKSFIRSLSCSTTNGKMRMAHRGMDSSSSSGSKSSLPAAHDELDVKAYCKYTNTKWISCIHSTTKTTAECCSYSSLREINESGFLAQEDLNAKWYPGEEPILKKVDLGSAQQVHGVGVLTDWWTKRPTEVRFYEVSGSGKGPLLGSATFPTNVRDNCGTTFEEDCAAGTGPSLLRVPINNAAGFKSLRDVYIEVEGLLGASQGYTLVHGVVVY